MFQKICKKFKVQMSYLEKGKGDKCFSDFRGHIVYPCNDRLKKTNKKRKTFTAEIRKMEKQHLWKSV